MRGLHSAAGADGGRADVDPEQSQQPGGLRIFQTCNISQQKIFQTENISLERIFLTGNISLEKIFQSRTGRDSGGRRSTRRRCGSRSDWSTQVRDSHVADSSSPMVKHTRAPIIPSVHGSHKDKAKGKDDYYIKT